MTVVTAHGVDEEDSKAQLTLFPEVDSEPDIHRKSGHCASRTL